MQSAAIEIRDAEFFYGSTRAVVVPGLEIAKNRITAFIGPSGCGKSTVLRAINRMNDLVPGARVTGEIRFNGHDLYGPDIDPVEVRRRIGMVFQKPNPFPKSIYDNVAYGPRLLGIRDKARLDTIVESSLRDAALWDEVKNDLKKSGTRFRAGSSSGCASPAPSLSSQRSS
ncbi:MAG: phosphate ABC transporter ATPase [Chloroflexi bacterium OLB13]|nr:MAG: phosphate ABC transporter ATPase [Chloroflexi bacterium OLB13]